MGHRPELSTWSRRSFAALGAASLLVMGCGDDAAGGGGAGGSSTTSTASGGTPSSTGSTSTAATSSTTTASTTTGAGGAAACGDDACDDGETCIDCLECCAEGFGFVWTPETPGPALTPEPCPGPTCIAVSDPSILREEDGTLRMWFSTGGIVPGGEDFVAVGPHIGLARRAPGAEDFEVDPATVVETAAVGAWDRHAETVTVIRDPSGVGYQMFYLGYEAQPGDPNHEGELHYQRPAIGQMIPLDDDGLAWGRREEPIYRPDPEGWDRFFVSGTSVVIGPDGVWRLYYAGAGTTVGVGLLTSEDGVTWTPSPNNPVLERDLDGWDQATLEPSVTYVGGRYWMWYSGYREPLDENTRISIGLATSEDGVTWERQGVVLEPGLEGTWNDLRILSSEVIVEPDGSLLMAAYGCNLRTRCDTETAIGLWRSP